jgi:hypothetical protein
MIGFQFDAISYTLRRGYANARAAAEDRTFLMGHKTNSEIHSHYHSAISTVHVQGLFRSVHATNAVEMNGLLRNRLQDLPQVISPEGWQRVEQDPEVIQYVQEVSQINADLRESYGSTATGVRSCDPMFPTSSPRLRTSRTAGGYFRDASMIAAPS